MEYMYVICAVVWLNVEWK